MAKLFVVATPIGNLQDITLRAIDVLKSVDIVFAEDTRVARKLLSHFEITKPIASFHKFSPQRVAERVGALLEEGKDIALITDAGTPGISDPGQYLISSLFNKSKAMHSGGRTERDGASFQDFPSKEKSGSFRVHGFDFEFEIIPIPGPSSLAAIISVSDIDVSEFTFLGFPPHKKGRKTFFERVAKSEVPVILFESPHRIIKSLKELEIACGDRRVNIGRELTKIYEEVFRGTLSEAQKYFTGEKERGEFVIVVGVV